MRLKQDSFCGKFAENGALFWETEPVRRTKAGETHQEASNGSRTGNHSRGKLAVIPDKSAFALIKQRPTSEAGEDAIFRW